MSIHRHPDATQAAQACAKHTLEQLTAAISERGAATLAISGGSSPKPMFEDFARSGFSWDRVHLFWVDERGVPPTDDQSNFKLASDTWLRRAKFPDSNIHRIEAERAPREAARLYQDDIRRYFRLSDDELPRFDVIHRGMGPDGHTASLFPGEELIVHGIASAVWVEKMQQWRITLLPGVLEAARHTVMLVTGADKAAILRAVLTSPYDPKQYPAQIASRGDSAEWFVDDAACGKLEAGASE